MVHTIVKVANVTKIYDDARLTISGVVNGLDSLLQFRETIPIEVQGLKEENNNNTEKYK